MLDLIKELISALKLCFIRTHSQVFICKNFEAMNSSTFVLILLIAIEVKASIIVKTTSGPVRSKAVASGKVEAFLGIPYAEPPVGSLRFRKPVPGSSWEDVYDANQLPKSCIQANQDISAQGLQHFSEDCLYLNLWVPCSHNKSERKPIILFIHGGGFMMGSSSESHFDGAALAQHGNLIVASINYRVGGLGFFTGFSDDAPGNIGMHDQVAALQWIKDNAENFQGDPKNIVLMGSSAGSMSVSAHLLSPLSKNLFRRAILLSGSILHPTYSENNVKLSNVSQKYASLLGCTPSGETLDTNPTSIIECMKKLPVDKFSEADTKVITNLKNYPQDYYSLILFPRVGDDLLPESTVNSFRKGNFKDTEILLGITRDEGSILLALFTPELFGKLPKTFTTPYLNETITRRFIGYIIGSDDKSEDEKITQAYMDGINKTEEYAYVKALSNVFGDYAISCGAIFQADMQSLRSNSVYFYEFEFLSATSPITLLPKWIGIPHAQELQYVFGNPPLREYSETEKNFTRDFMDRLVAFAKSGNPNIPNGVEWPRYTFEDPKYLVLDKEDTVKTKPNSDRCEVWRKRFGSIIDDDLIRKLKKSEF